MTTSHPSGSGPELETAHVLFVDIVGFSSLLADQQLAQLTALQELVREVAPLGDAVGGNDMLRLPTGDGMALVFFRNPTAPLRCAMALGRLLRERPVVRVRMGIHTGPVYRLEDINARANASGGALNHAQHIMNLGDAGHILVSGAMADLAAQAGTWPLSDLGECELKHGLRIQLFNLCTDDLGNPGRPRSLGSAVPIAASNSDAGPIPASACVDLGPPTGVLPLDSRFYIERPADADLRAAIRRRDSIVRIKGARQMGKTSLLARGFRYAREGGAQVLLTDFQMFNARHLESAESFFLTLARWVARELALDVDVSAFWDPLQGPNWNFREFVLTEVLSRVSEPLVWGLDEVDRLFGREYASEVFGLFRSWHNERALNPRLPWARLTLAMSYATEAHLFITDLNQSPFNVGTTLALPELTPDQTAELNVRYGGPLRGGAELARFFTLVGGQPYLTNRGLHEMATRGLGLEALTRDAETDDGLFADHLRRMSTLISAEPELSDAVRHVLRDQGCPTSAAFYRLRSAGVVKGHSAREATLVCALYETYLRRNLL